MKATFKSHRITQISLLMMLIISALFVFIFAQAGAQSQTQNTASTTSTTPAPATTQPQEPAQTTSIADNVCKGVLGTQTGKPPAPDTTVSDCSNGNGDQTLYSVLGRIINIFSIVVGSVSVIMIIVGGFRYIISGGDSSGVSGAKNTILYAVVGLIIVLFAQVLVRFVITSVTKI